MDRHNPDPSKTPSGFTMLTRMPNSPFSIARTRASWVSAALAALYAPNSLPGASTFFEAMKMRAPPNPCARSHGITACATRKCPVAGGEPIHGGHRRHTRIGHQKIQPAKGPEHRITGALDARLPGDVHRDAQGALATHQIGRAHVST